MKRAILAISGAAVAALATFALLGSSTPAEASSSSGGGGSAACSKTLGQQQGEPYSCRSIIAGCRAAGGGQFLKGCVNDLVGSQCDGCF